MAKKTTTKRRSGTSGSATRTATFLLKTEPDEFSYADLASSGTEPWDGVRNPAACMHLRAATVGDACLIYHTGREKRVVGLARVVRAAYEDPQHPGLTAKGDIKRPIIDIESVQEATSPVTLAQIKADERFAEFALVREPRLSVMPVPAKLAKLLCSWAGL